MTKLTAPLKVGNTLFQPGVDISTAQAAIHRLWHRHQTTAGERSVLLAALQRLVPADFDEHPDDFADDWHQARAAIAKATQLIDENDR